jgi:hypothetical protein
MQQRLAGKWESIRRTPADSDRRYSVTFSNPHHLRVDQLDAADNSNTAYDGDYQLSKGFRGRDVITTDGGQGLNAALLWDHDDLILQGTGAPIRLRRVR